MPGLAPTATLVSLRPPPAASRRLQHARLAFTMFEVPSVLQLPADRDVPSRPLDDGGVLVYVGTCMDLAIAPTKVDDARSPIRRSVGARHAGAPS